MQQQTLDLRYTPVGRASDRTQIQIDMEMDDRLSAGEALKQDEIDQISDYHLTLLRQCGLRKRGDRWRMPMEA